MKHRKFLAFLMAFALIAVLFAGCGAASNDAASPEEAYNWAVDDAAVATTQAASGLSGSTTQSAAATVSENQKLIITVYMDAETEDLDATLSHINDKLSELGGYMEAQDIYNGSAYANYRYRHADLTIRIPAEMLDQFVENVSEETNIVSKNESSQNVTLTYVATQSRITALETEEARLLELLAQAENMEDLLLIESRLTEVRTELEQVNSQLRVLDNQIDYSTIHLYLEEVREYTEVEEPETFWDRISSGFANSLENLGDFFVELAIFLIVAIPYLIPIGAVVVVVVILVKRNKKKNKKAPSSQDEQPK